MINAVVTVKSVHQTRVRCVDTSSAQLEYSWIVLVLRVVSPPSIGYNNNNQVVKYVITLNSCGERNNR